MFLLFLLRILEDPISTWEKREFLMISVVIVTQVHGLLSHECFSSWKFSSTGWLGKRMMFLFCNFCCQHSLLYYWKNNPCKTLILFSWCRKKKSEKHANSLSITLSMIHQLSSWSIKFHFSIVPKTYEKKMKANFEGEKARTEIIKEENFFFYVKWHFIHCSSVVLPSLLDHFHKTSLGILFYHWEYTRPLAAISQTLLRSHQGEWLAARVEGRECFFWLWCFLQGGGNSSAATFLVYSLSSLPWGGRVTYLMVNMKGITGYSRLKSEFILLGSELSTGSTIS